MNKWKPRKGDAYYFWSDYCCCALKTKGAFTDDDYLRCKVGNCFKTEEEAKTKGREIMEKIIEEYYK